MLQLSKQTAVKNVRKTLGAARAPGRTWTPLDGRQRRCRILMIRARGASRTDGYRCNGSIAAWRDQLTDREAGRFGTSEASASSLSSASSPLQRARHCAEALTRGVGRTLA